MQASGDLVLPALRQICESKFGYSLLGDDNLQFGVEFHFDDRGNIDIPDRTELDIGCEDVIVHWRADSLRALFRGNKTPPDMKEYPPEYVPIFAAIEKPIYDYSTYPGMSLPDVDFKEIFSAMRRRPDGRRINLVHDLVWQATALALAMHPCCEAEYNAIFLRLEQSTRKFNMGQSSKLYLWYLGEMFNKKKKR